MQRERPVETTLAFHASRIVIDIGVLLTMAAMSLPFVVSDLGDRSALDADALPTILLLLPVFAITLVPDHTRPIHPVAAWAALGLGLAALPYAVIKLLDAVVLADTLDGSLGFGAYVLIIGTIVTIVGIGIGLYRDVRGLPAGGTPRRATAYSTRSRRRPSAEPAPAPSATTGPSADSASDDAGGDDDEPAAPVPSTKRDQPDFVVAGDGAAERSAVAAPDDPVDTTAERADAAIDDHFMSMFDREDGDEDD